MKRSFILSLFLTLTLMFLFAGCSTRPDDQIARADEAMKKAQEQHAEYFAPEDWNAAKQAWDQAQAKLEKKSYGEANTLLLKAQTRFRKSADIATGKRQDAIREIEGFQKTAELRCKALREATDKSKLAPAKKKTFEETCKDIEQKLSQVKTKLDGGEYQDAKFLAQTTLRQVWETQKELEGALGGKKIS
jgi:hypothetical protein